MLKDYKAYWFSYSFFPIGIVKTPSGKTYIGTGIGGTEEEDTKYIAQHGMPINLFSVIKTLGIKKDEV